MAQFDVHVLLDGTTVVDLQSDLLSAYRTRLVAPLLAEAEIDIAASRLHPAFRIDGQRLLLAPQLASAVPVRTLGPAIASLGAHEYTIKAALDVLITGV